MSRSTKNTTRTQRQVWSKSGSELYLQERTHFYRRALPCNSAFLLIHRYEVTQRGSCRCVLSTAEPDDLLLHSHSPLSMTVGRRRCCCSSKTKIAEKNFTTSLCPTQFWAKRTSVFEQQDNRWSTFVFFCQVTVIAKSPGPSACKKQQRVFGCILPDSPRRTRLSCCHIGS